MLEKLKNLYKSFYCAEYYSDVAVRHQGIGLGFVFILIAAILHFASIFGPTFEPARILLSEQRAVLETMPTLTFEKGTISSDAPPQTIDFLRNHPEIGVLRVMIDTQSEPLDDVALTKKMLDEQIYIFVDQKGISILDPANHVLKRSPATEFKDMVIGHEKWMQISTILDSFLLPSSILSMFLLVLVFHAIWSLLGSVSLALLSTVIKVQITFAGAFRLATLSMVPMSVLFLVLTPVPVMQLLVWGGFAVFGLLATKKTQKLA